MKKRITIEYVWYSPKDNVFFIIYYETKRLYSYDKLEKYDKLVYIGVL